MDERVTEASRRVGARVHDYLEGTGPRPAKPLFGVLPIQRIVPQDVHSVLDYVSSAAAAASSIVAETPAAVAAGVSLAAVGASLSAVSDCRLSVAKLIPIEAHELVDYILGAALVAAPFVFGHYKKDVVASALTIAAGATTILVSLLTDYRATKGLGTPAAERLA